MIVRVTLALTLLLTITAVAQELRVGLFTASAPAQLELLPVDSTMRACIECQPTKLTQPITFTAAANRVRYATGGSAVVLISGHYRLRVTGTLTAELAAPLEIRSVHGSLRLVARMPLEQYVAFAVGGEAGGIKEQEALKAMAVAIRTYAVKFRARHQDEAFDLCDSTHCQVLRLAASELWTRSAEETQGEMVWYQGELAYAYHHASCGGMLADGRALLHREVPYLRTQADNVCANGEEWDAQIGHDELRRALLASGFHLASGDGVAIMDRDRSGRARTLRVDGAPVLATSFRMAIGRELGWNKIRSDIYDVRDEGSSILFRGRGRGHGVGLCQTGAQLRAQRGAGYRDILAFYYPGTSVGLTASGLAWIRFAGERVELQTTNEDDKSVLAAAEQTMREVEHRTGWTLAAKPNLRVYPTVSAFRDLTGEPGWLAASSIGRTIRMQPLTVLRSKGVLASTLRHELLHMLVEQQARPGTPLWFREGLVLYLAGQRPARAKKQLSIAALQQTFQQPSSEAALRLAYAEARQRVASLVEKNGEATVLKWVQEGLPRSFSE